MVDTSPHPPLDLCIAGSALELLQGTAHGANSQANFPSEHVETLRGNPYLAFEFDRVYGRGKTYGMVHTYPQ